MELSGISMQKNRIYNDSFVLVFVFYIPASTLCYQEQCTLYINPEVTQQTSYLLSFHSFKEVNLCFDYSKSITCIFDNVFSESQTQANGR